MQNKLIRPAIFVGLLIIAVLFITFIFNSPKAQTVPDSKLTPAPTTQTSNTASTKTYTLAQVSQHKTETDCWTAINGEVYDLTPFINSHPGGVENITMICGIDGTSAFNNQHGGQDRPTQELNSLLIGILTK